MENNIKQPQIKVDYKEIYPSLSDRYVCQIRNDNAGTFFPDFDMIVLSYGIFTQELLEKYHRTIEKQTCNTISHEIIHWWILKELNIKACVKFDDIAESLAEYGVY